MVLVKEFVDNDITKTDCIHNGINPRSLQGVLKYFSNIKTVENRLIIFNGAIQDEKHDDPYQDIILYHKDSNKLKQNLKKEYNRQEKKHFQLIFSYYSKHACRLVFVCVLTELPASIRVSSTLFSKYGHNTSSSKNPIWTLSRARLKMQVHKQLPLWLPLLFLYRLWL